MVNIFCVYLVIVVSVATNTPTDELTTINRACGADGEWNGTAPSCGKYRQYIPYCMDWLIAVSVYRCFLVAILQ